MIVITTKEYRMVKKAEKEVKEVKKINDPIVEEVVVTTAPEKTTKKVTAKAGKRSAKSLKEEEAIVAKKERKEAKIEQESQPTKVIKNKTRTSLERKGKNFKRVAQLIDKNIEYKLDAAMDLIKKTSTTKFDSSVEVHIRLNVDPKQSDQNVRDTIVLPFGTGKTVKIAALTDDSKLAQQSGADIFIAEDIFSALDKNVIDFDILITTPALMPKLSKYARILGPRGLMPNPKSGTVTNDINVAINEAKNGKIEYRVDSYGIIHLSIGKVSFSATDLLANANAFLTSLKSNKPQSVKVGLIRTAYLTTTMGPSVKLDISDLF